MAAKAPMLAYNHFVESLFVLNDCHAASRAGRTLAPGGGGGGGLDPLTVGGGGLMHLAGATADMRSKRDFVYHTLLKRMAPEHKFSTQAKLVSEVRCSIPSFIAELPAEASTTVHPPHRMTHLPHGFLATR